MSEAVILALECSRRCASLAIQTRGECFSTEMDPQQSQSSLLLPLVKDFLKKHHVHPEQVTDLGIHVGPGGSTGLRMGVALAQAWSMVYKVRVHAVPLEALALEVLKEAPAKFSSAQLLADAFGGQFFRARYENKLDQWHMIGGLELIDKTEAKQYSARCYVVEDLGRLKTLEPWPESWVWHGGIFPQAQQVLQATLNHAYLCPIQQMDVRYLKASSAEINWTEKNKNGVSTC